MMKKHAFPIPLSRAEVISGICYILISQLALPYLIGIGSQLLKLPLSSAQLNFLYFAINFAVVLWLFRRFLGQSLRYALRIPIQVLWYAALGYLGSDLLTTLISSLCYRMDPSFYNLNNQAVADTVNQAYVLSIIGTVLLVPVAEEVLYRGVVFRGLYGKSPIGAYIVSCLLFAAIHVVGYLDSYSPFHCLLALLQYLPAAYCLCWAYRQTGTIVCPMLMHALVNGLSIYYAMR